MKSRLERDPQQMAHESIVFPVNVAEFTVVKQADIQLCGSMSISTISKRVL
jgi:hypothetical protein